jgi:hypothetical protein
MAVRRDRFGRPFQLHASTIASNCFDLNRTRARIVVLITQFDLQFRCFWNIQVHLIPSDGCMTERRHQGCQAAQQEQHSTPAAVYWRTGYRSLMNCYGKNDTLPGAARLSCQDVTVCRPMTSGPGIRPCEAERHPLIRRERAQDLVLRIHRMISTVRVPARTPCWPHTRIRRGN